MRYGLPYQGSKNKIAKWVISVLPRGGTLYDLFCGGCAVTHAAMLTGKYDRFVINDINSAIPGMFVKAISGGFADEKRVIDRETFDRLKETDPYVALCWSFGNNAAHYLWNDETAGAKLLACKMIMADTWQERRQYYRQFIQYLQKKREELEERKARVADCCCQSPQSLESLERLQDLESLERLERVAGLERLERVAGLERLERVQSLGSLESLQRQPDVFQGDYADVPIGEDGVIYCDIPYRNTQGYVSGDFDYERFYTWAESQELPVFISEYQMPEDRFRCIAEREKTSGYSSNSNSTKTTEKIFIPIHQSYSPPASGLF